MSPSSSKPTPAKRAVPKRRRGLRTAVIVVAVGLAAAVVPTAGGFTFASTQEQRDPFCASCHTQPESTF